MPDDLSVGNSAEVVQGTPQAEPNNASSLTNASSGEATQSATTSDSFIPEGVDINTLPPNVRAIVDKINKDMVRGFTEKTTKLSDTIKSEAAKASEAYKSKADLYEQISSQEEFVKQWNEYVQKVNTTPQNPQDSQMNTETLQLKSQLEEIKQKIELTELNQVTDAFAEAMDEKGEKLHPEFDKLNDIVIGALNQGQEAEEYSLLRAHIELAPGNTPQEKLVNGYKTAKATYDGIFEEGRKAGMGRLEKKVLNGTQPPSNSGSGMSTTEKKPKDAYEALEMAKRGIMVTR